MSEQIRNWTKPIAWIWWILRVLSGPAIINIAVIEIDSLLKANDIVIKQPHVYFHICTLNIERILSRINPLKSQFKNVLLKKILDNLGYLMKN